MREITVQEVLTQHIFEPSELYFEPDHCRCGAWFERPGQKAWAHHVASMIGKIRTVKYPASDPAGRCPHRPVSPIANDRWKCTLCGQIWSSVEEWLKERRVDGWLKDQDDRPSENSRTFEERYLAWLPKKRRSDPK